MELNNICEFIIDCPHSTAEDEGEGYPLIRTPNIGKGHLVLEGVHRVCEEVYLQRNLRGTPQDNDLIFAREAPAGNVAIVKNGEKVCLGQRTVLLRPNQMKVNPVYLAYYLLAPEQQYRLVGRANGSTVAHVNLPTIRCLKIDLPPMANQNRIAFILSVYDELIEKNNRKIAILQEQAQEIYKEWFVRMRFPGHETSKFENGLPEGWKVARVKGCVKRLPFNQLYKEYELDGEGLVVVIDQSEKEQLGFHNNEPSHIASYKKPICLFGDHSCKFKLMTEPFSLGENIVPFVGDGIDTYYLFYATHKIIETEEYKRHWRLFVSKKIFIPSEELQFKFASHTELIIKQIELLKKQNRLITKQCDFLFPRLMSGKLEVH